MAYMGFPPLYGGEITIILFSLFLIRTKKLRPFIENPIGKICIFYLLIAIVYIFIAYNDVGIDCMRYGAISYYAIFIYFGYTLLDSRPKQRFFINALYYAISLSICHTVLCMVTPLSQLSPVINGIHLFGNLDQISIFNILALPYVIILWLELGFKKSLILGILGLLSCFYWMNRASMLSLMGMTFVLLLSHKIWLKSSVKNIYIFGCGFIVVSIILILSVFQNSTISRQLKYQGDLFTAIWSDSSNLPGKAGTKQHRIEMWTEIVTETLESDPFFGQGYRDKLVNVAFFNPHNSFISFFGRMGVLGLFLVLLIYFGIPITIARSLKVIKDKEYQSYLLIYLCFITSCLAVSLTAPTFESPYSALVCNFVFGGALRLYSMAVNKKTCNLSTTYSFRERT
ncbi:MAG: O-antigen ligase family protein [Sedimentisphaerales bacterium]|nr:O-antigen ligase family protein [Sedimentisphaerales bacterium]